MQLECSIIICTYNRSEVLAKTLSFLHDQVAAFDGVEVIVVDNASTDSTSQVVAKFPHVVYIHESAAGLSNARNRGVSEAKFDRILFIDDDVVIDDRWLDAYHEFFESKNEGVTFWGGPVMPHHEVEIEKPLSETDLRYMSRAWSLVDPSGEPERIESKKQILPIGANFGGLKSVFMELKFSPALGRRGEKLTSCEEMDLLHRCIDNGGVGQWVQSAALGHRIPPERTSKVYLARFYCDYGRSEQSLRGDRGLFQLLGLCVRYKFSAWLGRLVGGSRQLRNFVKWHYYKGRLLQALSKA